MRVVNQILTVVSLMIFEEILTDCFSVLINDETVPLNVELYIFAFKLILNPPFIFEAIACR